jgi:hypothetical protein
MQFNWHELDTESFLSWMVVNLIAGRSNEKLFTELSESTNGFTEVDMHITINGVELDPKHFADSIQHNMTYMAEQAAKEMLTELGELDTLRESLNDFQENVAEKLLTLSEQFNLARD